jgi:hypothetical protein
MAEQMAFAQGRGKGAAAKLMHKRNDSTGFQPFRTY